jgi:ankyrin repeat protein
MASEDAKPNEDKPIHAAARDGIEPLKLLLNRNPILRDEPGWYSRQPIHVAAEAGRLDCVNLLLTLGASPNAREGLYQQTPLHFGVGSDSIECVERLLDAGADVNAADSRGETPLFYAKSRCVVQRLADAGANLGVISGRGQYPFEYCAAYIRSVEVMQFWIERGVNLNHVPKFGWPALNAVCGMPYSPQEIPDHDRDVALLDLLITHGADVSLRGKDGETALYDACINWHTRLAERLLIAGADPNQPNRSGDTPLHAAVFRQDEPLVRLLLENGADVNIANRRHKTPYDICEVDGIRSLLAPHYKPQTTPVPMAEQCIERLRAIPKFQHVAIVGCSEDEIDKLEQECGVQLPSAYREFLSRMGKGIGEFMVSDRWLFKLDDLSRIARDPEYMQYCDLPANYFVFAVRDGYYGTFFVADGTSDDPPVFAFTDGEGRGYKQIGRSIWEFVESLVIDYELWSEDGEP